jgi:molecular chaperone HtpG
MSQFLKIQLPTKFEKIVKGKNEGRKIANTIAAIEQLYDDNQMFFFKEYTDHGINHLQEVLDSSSDLITAAAYSQMTPESVCALVMAILLHDIGMHMSWEGFKSLINGCLTSSRISSIDSKSWDEEWSNYVDYVNKLDRKSLESIFGENISDDFVIYEIAISKIDENISYQSRNMIGEFIRLNHARLAHEIALGGFPIAGDSTVDVLGDEDIKKRKIVGIIARSHNMAVRDTEPYLKSIESAVWYSIDSIHTVYLMILIRLADLIQIHATRANKGKLKFRNLHNPISRREWAKHNSITNITTTTTYPESIYVSCSPENSEIFLELQSLIKYIQYELDLSWAIIGEVYNVNPYIKKLAIKYRRVTSNIIEDFKNFATQAQFIPQEAVFEPTKELQRLLIAPLYGSNPTYGIRELVQNAVDACKSRQFKETQSGRAYTPKINIVIKEENDKFIFSISDNGIGMTSETIINYFLKSGSSFKRDTNWKNNFVDKRGRPAVTRVGRFGIGALASFLLSDKIKVITRYYLASNEQAHIFDTELDTRQINIVKCSAPIGTSIEFVISSELADILHTQLNTTLTSVLSSISYSYIFKKEIKVPWNKWYLFSTPKISIEVPSGWKYQTVDFIPDWDQDLGVNYNAFTPEGYDKVVWGFGHEAKLLCNGFIISNGYEITKYKKISSSISNLPTVSVLDKYNNFPLSLNRESINNDSLPFEKELIKEVYLDVMAFILNFKNIDRGVSEKISFNCDLLNYPAFKGTRSDTNYNRQRLCFSKKGYGLFCNQLLQTNKIKRIIEVWTNTNEEGYPITLFPDNDSVYIFYNDRQYQHMFEREDESANTIEKSLLKGFDEFDVFDRNLISRHSIISEKILIVNPNDFRSLGEITHSMVEEIFNSSFIMQDRKSKWAKVILKKDEFDYDLNFNKDEEHFLNENSSIISQVVINNIESYLIGSDEEDQFVYALYNEHFKTNIMIPYNVQLRKNKFSHTYDSLQKYFK